MTFYMTSTNQNNWEKIKAKTIRGAKITATRVLASQGKSDDRIYIGFDSGCGIKKIAQRAAFDGAMWIDHSDCYFLSIR